MQFLMHQVDRRVAWFAVPMLMIVLSPLHGVGEESDDPSVTEMAESATTSEPTFAPIGIVASNGESMNQAKQVHSVVLRIDGNLAGRAITFGPTGTVSPTQAKISFLQEGKVVSQSRSDEWGRFQMTGLQPGVYSVHAVSPSGIGLLSVVVLPFDPETSEENLLLEITLVPNQGLDLFTEKTPATIPEAPAEPPTSAGGGAGGGGGAALLGLVGLAGLAGLSGGGSGSEQIITPSVP